MSEPAESPGDPEGTTVVETIRLLRADRARLDRLLRDRGISASAILSPSFLCVALYRISRYLFVNGRTIASRLVWQVNLFLTGADISPICRLGAGLVVIHPVAATIVGSAGRCLTVEGHGGLGGGLALNDIGAGPGLPLLGDEVHLARGASILGPVRIGDRVRIGPGCTVVRDLPDDAEVPAHEVLILRRTRSSTGGTHDAV